MTSQYLNETFDITINLSNAFLLRDEKKRAEFIRCRFERKEIHKRVWSKWIHIEATRI